MSGLREMIKDKLNPGSWLKDLLFTGVGAVGLSMSYQLFEVLKEHPELLMKWGPNFVLWLLGITVVGILANQLVDAMRQGSENLVESTRSSAEAQTVNAQGMSRMAEAMQRIADQGDGQMREIQAEVTYTATEIRRVHERLTGLDDALKTLLAAQLLEAKKQATRSGETT